MPGILTITYRKTKFRLGDTVRVRGFPKEGTRLIRGFYSDIKGGVILEKSVDGNRSWNVENLILVKRNLWIFPTLKALFRKADDLSNGLAWVVQKIAMDKADSASLIDYPQAKALLLKCNEEQVLEAVNWAYHIRNR